MPGIERTRVQGSAEEEHRLEQATPWRLWGPYLSGRAWGRCARTTPRRRRLGLPALRAGARPCLPLGRGRIGGICDRFGFLNLSLAMWNGRDPLLKERLFGLTTARATTART